MKYILIMILFPLLASANSTATLHSVDVLTWKNRVILIGPNLPNRYAQDLQKSQEGIKERDKSGLFCTKAVLAVIIRAHWQVIFTI